METSHLKRRDALLAFTHPVHLSQIPELTLFSQAKTVKICTPAATVAASVQARHVAALPQAVAVELLIQLDTFVVTMILCSASRCKSEMYCSAECQKAAWSTHKLLCKPVSGIMKQNPQQEEDINSWCMDETVRSDLTRLAAYGLHATPPAQSLVGSSAMIVQAKYNAAKRTVVIQHAQIMSLEVLRKVAVVPQDAMGTTSPRGHARLIVTMCFATSAGRTAVFELAPAQIIIQLSKGESMNAEQQDVKFQQLLAEAKDYERSCVEPAMCRYTALYSCTARRASL
eukprot:2694-Heterococcus_DN1.PRE.1